MQTICWKRRKACLLTLTAVSLILASTAMKISMYICRGTMFSSVSLLNTFITFALHSADLS